jgi:hypothetical protein
MLADPYDNYYLACMEQKRKFTQFISGLILIIVCITVTLAACSIWGTNQQNQTPSSLSISKNINPNLPGDESKITVTPPEVVLPALTTNEPIKQMGNLGSFEQGSIVEIAFSGPLMAVDDPDLNPFLIEMEVSITGPDGQVFLLPAFYDGDGMGGTRGNVWKVRFVPDAPGSWLFTSDSSQRELNRYQGTFSVAAAPDCQTPGPDQSPNIHCLGFLEASNGHYLRFSSGEYWIKAGVDDPENFLGTAIGDWQDKKDAIDFLSSKGVNSIYVITNNIDGDRQDTWPWYGETQEAAKKNSERFDIVKLQLWEDFFNYVQSKGIVIHLVLNDDGAWHDYNQELYYREMVARFAHLPGLIWNIGEEANEIYSDGQQINLASHLQSLDPYDHPVTVHRTNPWRFIGNPNFDLTSIQVGDGAADFSKSKLPDLNRVVIDHISSSDQVCQPIPVMIDEIPRVTKVDQSSRLKLREEVIYPIYFGGGNFELHFYDAYGDGTLSFEDLGPMLDDLLRAHKFMETLPFYTMEPCNEMVMSGAAGCFQRSGDIYAVYSSKGNNPVLDMRTIRGNFEVYWFDPRTGNETHAGVVSGGKILTFTTPDSQDWVLKLDNPQVQADLIESESTDDPDFLVGGSKYYLPVTLQARACGD